MVNRNETYVLAVPRAMRGAVRSDWQDRVRKLGGIAEGVSASSFRIQIEADARALERIREEFGEMLMIEPKAPRMPTE